MYFLRVCLIVLVLMVVVVGTGYGQCAGEGTLNPRFILASPCGNEPTEVRILDIWGDPCPDVLVVMDIHYCEQDLFVPTYYEDPLATTNANGVATFSPALGGVCEQPYGARFFIVDPNVVDMVAWTDVIITPDRTGDGVVNISDVPYLAYAYYYEYDVGCDYNYDGIVNLSDVAVLATHINCDAR